MESNDERKKLKDLYDPYIVDSDTSLADARKRLRTALHQTRTLQTAFTERVFGKYNVHLKEPDHSFLSKVQSNPQLVLQQVNEERQRLKHEKELEKRLNEEDLFYSAGLHLVQTESQKVPPKISQAAQAAGHAVIERTKENALMRIERQRKQQLQLLAGEDTQTTNTDTTNLPLSRDSIISVAKASSIEDDILANKLIQQRLAHPHPESQGGQRRKSTSSEPLSQELLNLTLPPLVKDCTKLDTIPIESKESLGSIRAVLDPFPVTKIELLHNLKQIDSNKALLAFKVLHSLGVIGRTNNVANDFVLPETQEPSLAPLREQLLAHNRPLTKVATGACSMEPETQSEEPSVHNDHSDQNGGPNQTSSAPDGQKVASVTPTNVRPPTPTEATNQALLFHIPVVPPGLSAVNAELIVKGKFYEAVEHISQPEPQYIALDYLSAIGSAVPIPKALIMTPLRDRLNTPGFKNGGGIPPLPREVIASCILTWLWTNHKNHFQRAFDKSGRLDVDPSCKWLIQAAIDTAIRELSLEIADSMARGEGAFAQAANARKIAMANRAQVSLPANDPELRASARNVDICTAVVVSKGLMTELSIDKTMDSIVTQFPRAMEYLHESRLCALRLKARERALLANLIARKATMTESFSHAYTNAMVRAGEVLGHDALFEAAQDEKTMSSTMIPYDIFTDEVEHEWEDPCKPEEGYTVGMNAEALVRRAHARAMIQKSLRKMQDRHGIRGGVHVCGPYSDPTPEDLQAKSKEDEKTPPATGRGIKRRMSSLTEPPVPAGTGSAAASSWSQYDPNHYSVPLHWDGNLIENKPYGKYSQKERSRSVSLSLSGIEKKKPRTMSMSNIPVYGAEEEESVIPRSTHAIRWEDVAGIFQDVEVPDKTPSKQDAHHGVVVLVDGQIIAPVCRKLESVPSGESEEEEEDLREESILARHQAVLDEMKARLNAVIEARKRKQQNKKKKARVK